MYYRGTGSALEASSNLHILYSNLTASRSRRQPGSSREGAAMHGGRGKQKARSAGVTRRRAATAEPFHRPQGVAKSEGGPHTAAMGGVDCYPRWCLCGPASSRHGRAAGAWRAASGGAANVGHCAAATEPAPIMAPRSATRRSTAAAQRGRQRVRTVAVAGLRGALAALHDDCALCEVGRCAALQRLRRKEEAQPAGAAAWAGAVPPAANEARGMGWLAGSPLISPGPLSVHPAARRCRPSARCFSAPFCLLRRCPPVALLKSFSPSHPLRCWHCVNARPQPSPVCAAAAAE